MPKNMCDIAWVGKRKFAQGICPASAEILLISILLANLALAGPTTKMDSPANTKISKIQLNNIVDAPKPYLNPMTRIGYQINSPKSASAHFPIASNQLNIKVLPPTPTALIMVLIGFSCVTFIKDRKTWITALAAVISLSCAAITYAPCVIRNVSRDQNISKNSAKFAIRLNSNNQKRSRQKIQGTDYFSLVKFLNGIPSGRSIRFINFQRLVNHYKKLHPANILTLSKAVSNSEISNNTTLISKLDCSQVTLFNPAFTFQLSPRGPPA